MMSLTRNRSALQTSKAFRNRGSHAAICLGMASLLLGSLLSPARAVTVFNVTSQASWTNGANWDNGLPDSVDDGQIASGFIALGDGLISSADIFVQNGGTLRVTDSSNIISGSNTITVENGGRIEYTGDKSSADTIRLLDGASPMPLTLTKIFC